MTTTPLATIADALIEFILSLLRDPSAVAEFEEDPDAALARAGLSDICAEDVRSVVPVIVDRPDVAPKPPLPPRDRPEPPPVIKEIMTVSNNFHIDNRSVIVDQSVNQNIFTEGGDLTQVFDQESVMAFGDDSLAAGNDASVEETDTDVTIGDISVGNTTTTNDIDNSFNDDITETSTSMNVEATDSFNEEATAVAIADSFNDSVEIENEVEIENDTTTVYADVEVEDSVVMGPVVSVEEETPDESAYFDQP